MSFLSDNTHGREWRFRPRAVAREVTTRDDEHRPRLPADAVKARAVTTDGAGGYRVETIDVGDPGPGEVLVEIAASGVCHTDYDFAVRSGADVVLGHEGAGTVTSVGPGVDGVAPGERVLLTWAIACGSCFQCVRGAQVLCELMGQGPGGHAHPAAATKDGRPLTRAFNLGTMSTATVVREEAVVAIGDEIPFASACILGCGVMTGFGSVTNAAEVVPGSSVAVLGTGGVGLNVVQAARIAGATTIIAVDVSEERLSMAISFGATDAVLASRDDRHLVDAATRVRALTDGRGADYAFECTAVPELAVSPLAMIRHGGTAVQVSGVEQDVVVDMNLFEWDKTYINPLYGQCRPSVDFPRLLSLYARGMLLLDEMVTRTYALEDVGTAFDDMHAGRNAKGVLVMS